MYHIEELWNPFNKKKEKESRDLNSHSLREKNTSGSQSTSQSEHAGDSRYNLFHSLQQTHSHLLATEGQINL